MKDKSKKSTYSTTFGVDPTYGLKNNAQGGTRTPTTVKPHEPESCVSTNFTT